MKPKTRKPMSSNRLKQVKQQNDYNLAKMKERTERKRIKSDEKKRLAELKAKSAGTKTIARSSATAVPLTAASFNTDSYINSGQDFVTLSESQKKEGKTDDKSINSYFQ